MKLTPKQEAFAQHYALHGNTTEAYKAAGYSWKRMKNNTLGVEAAKLLAHPRVSLRVAELQSRVQKRAEEKFDLTAESTDGAWQITTGANVSVIAIGDFS